jgi:hypothetical protein
LVAAGASGLGAGPATGLDAPPDRDGLIAYGPLLSDDGVTWLGTAALIQAPDPDAARTILTPDRYAHIEVHNWQPGGRRHDRKYRPSVTPAPK